MLKLNKRLNVSLSGTVAVTQNSPNVVGTNTSFTTELEVGDAILIENEIFSVSAITDNTHLTLDSNYLGTSASGLAAYADPFLFEVIDGNEITKFYLNKSGRINEIWKLPSVDGSANQVLKTDGAGNLGWLNSQALGSGDSPTFAGLTLTGLSGVLKAAAGVVSGSAILNDIGAPTSDFSMNSKKLTSVADPVSAQDAATKNYVDTFPPYAARAYLSATQEDIVNNTLTSITLNTESYDIGSNFSTVDNRFDIPVNGYYWVNANVIWTSVVADKRYEAFLRNSTPSTLAYSITHSSHAAVISQVVSCLRYFEAGDFIKLAVRHQAGVNTVDVLGGGDYYTFLEVVLIRTA